ncbi:MAG: DUF4159 domain-containing protein [Planctomycetota bacterium]
MSRKPRIDRRSFVKMMSIGGASFLTSPLLGQSFRDQSLANEARRAGFGQEPDKGALIHWARMKFRCDNGVTENWSVHPQGDFTLVQAINDQATTNVDEMWNVADVNDLDAMANFPLLFMHAESAPNLTPKEKANLREYMLRGGFVYAEDCVNGYRMHGMRQNGPWDFFFVRMRDVMREIMPEARVERLPLDHPIFHCYYRLPNGQPHMQGKPHGGWGVTLKGRLMAYISPSDAHCGWVTTEWFGRKQSQEALKIGTNVYLYAMTH